MQPTDHISTGKLYSFFPSKISGARYHKVSTSCVRVLIGIPKALAKPKSANFKILPFSTRIFYGLRSL